MLYILESSVDSLALDCHSDHSWTIEGPKALNDERTDAREAPRRFYRVCVAVGQDR